MKSKRTKALEISKEVKRKVYERDNEHCLLCGRWVHESNACCHFIARSQGGLGIEENILTLCSECHTRYDNSEHRQELKKRFRDYLRGKYNGWTEEKLIYKKWR